ncbi:MAG TPA: hypothetical protein VNU21_12525 [Usitatibacter sp.]|nr:hypothetical protein [Usitatibacter sp.]
MGDISSEARDLASRLATGVLESLMTGNRADPERDIADALQRHMDATEKAERHAKHWEQAAWDQQKRAEKAESKLAVERAWFAASQRGLAEANARAEKAEAAYAELRATSIEKLRLEESARAEAAEQRLDDLVREVGQWWDSDTADAIDLSVLLRKYEQPTKVQP